MQFEQPQNIRVFVSSTFVDLFHEREYLVKRIFPEIRHVCRERGLLFTEVDLRWGLTYEDSGFGRVISTCLQEIDRCRPFFIGILGDRYGWIPEFSDIHKNAFLVEEHHWIEEAVLEGASLVEMEFNYAVLNTHESMPGASFYILDREPASDQPKFEQTELSDNKLERLRERIYDCKRPVRTFKTPEELGAQVREDLLRAIDVLYPAKNERSPLARERRLHEAFSISRRQAYVARQETLQKLNDHVTSDAPPLIVHADSGFGKSALLAYWGRFYAQRHPEVSVVTHFIGSVSSDAGHESLLRRILMETKDLLHLEDAIPDTLNEMELALGEWLAKVPEQKLVLVIDALNQLEPRAAGLEWLPQHLPSNVRIILSTTPGPTLDALRTRGWPEYELQPLTFKDREAMITRFLSEFHKALPLSECQQIARDDKTASPLFLRTLLEELRLFGAYERLDERIRYYLSTDDTSDLFQRVLDRIEDDFGEDLIHRLMTLVWASRSGLTEDDFLSLTRLTRAGASQLLIALEYHLVQRQGYIRFFHDHLNEAVERKYLADDESRRKAHAELGKFYLTEPSSERRASELPYQLGEGGMLEELRDWLVDIPEFMRYATEDEQWRFIGYWLKLDGKYDRAKSYEDALDEYKSNHTEVEHALALEHVGRFMIACGDSATAEKMLSIALPIIESKFGEEDVRTAESITTYGELMHALGKYSEAENLLSRGLQMFEKIYGTDNLRVAKALDTLGATLHSQGAYMNAENAWRRSLHVREERLGLSHPDTLEALLNVGVMLYSTQSYSGAAEIFEIASARALQSLGKGHPTYSYAISNLAAAKLALNEREEAIRLYRIALKSMEKVLGATHPQRIQSLLSLGTALKMNGNLEEAEEYCIQALNSAKLIHGIEHPITAKTQLNLGQLLTEQGRNNEASEVLSTALQTFKNSLGSHHASTIRTSIALAGSYHRSGKHHEAVTLYEAFLDKYDEGPENNQKARSFYEDSLKLIREGDRALRNTISSA